jgi:hypothetical protein
MVARRVGACIALSWSINRYLALFIVVASCARSAFAQPLTYGMNVQLDVHPQSAPVADKLKELGASVLRVPFGWDIIEARCKGCFDWNAPDAWRDQARRTGRTIFASLGFTPQWANGGKPYSYPPLNYDDWYDFVYAVVSRYRDDIFLWGIWNEPNLDSYVHGGDLRAYEALAATARAAILAANPRASILGPEVSHHAFKDGWFAAAMDAFGDLFDVVTVHWYPDGPDLALTMDRFVRPFARNKEVWLTEVGLQPCASTFGETAQALLYQRVLDAFRDRRNWWTGVVFYDLYELPKPRDCGSAIVRPDWSNRPAFRLLQAFIKANP